jgi:hypothetical protein
MEANPSHNKPVNWPIAGESVPNNRTALRIGIVALALSGVVSVSLFARPLQSGGTGGGVIVSPGFDPGSALPHSGNSGPASRPAHDSPPIHPVPPAGHSG